MSNFTFFWGNESPFSNWHKSDFVYKCIKFCTSEQAMMWEKAMLFGDKASAEEVLKTRNPKLQKEIGRGVKGYVDAEWNAVREQLVFNILVDKFTQNESMLLALLKTGDTIIVEASPYDKVWGIGLGENDPRAKDPAQWQGTNLLGKVLTELREILKYEYNVANPHDIRMPQTN
jgi:ribA/ribD-fused uncharacterized protein